MNVEIKRKDGVKMDGEGASLGSDLAGTTYTFWRSTGSMEVPHEVALRLELESPQRFEIVDREVAKRLLSTIPTPSVPLAAPLPPVVLSVEPTTKGYLTLKQITKMTKDQLNDWAAKNDYDINPMKQKSSEMILSIIKQIEKRTGKKVAR
jgi:hypothetical protein